MQKLFKSAMAVAAMITASVAATPAAAAVVVFNTTNIDSFGALGNAGNSVFFVDIGAFSEVTGLTWDVNITAFAPSWLSEARVALTDSAFTRGVVFKPGFLQNVAGTQTFTGSANYVDLSDNFFVGVAARRRRSNGVLA